MSLVLRPIGVLRSCYAQKFGIPRQPGLVPSATATLHLDREVVTRDALRGLEAWTHAWVIFHFHVAHDVKMTVRPPRLGGARRMGVLATRSPHRPNHLGLSAVALGAVDPDAMTVELRGGDFLDGTPCVDLKPYVPYADSIPDAGGAWADTGLVRQPVRFTDEGRAACDAHPQPGGASLADLVAETLSHDPRRPRARDGGYALKIGDLDVLARIEDGAWLVEGVVVRTPSAGGVTGGGPPVPAPSGSEP